MSTTQKTNPVQTFRDLRAKERGVSTDELDGLFRELRPVACEDMIGGRWKGGYFRTGHKAGKWLDEVRWYGKEFNSHLDVKPLLCKDDRGNIYSKDLNGGEASLWRIEFRGVVSAAMVYDRAAIVDHFRLVDPGTVMGIMTGKDEKVLDGGKFCHFYLER